MNLFQKEKPRRKTEASLIFPIGSLSTASATMLTAGARIVPQCLYPGEPFYTPNGFLFCFPFCVAWLFIKGSCSNFPKDAGPLPHLLKTTKGAFKRFLFSYLDFNHVNHLQSVVCGFSIKLFLLQKSRRFYRFVLTHPRLKP